MESQPQNSYMGSSIRPKDQEFSLKKGVKIKIQLDLSS